MGTLFPPKVNFEFGREYKHPNLRKMHAVQSALAVRRERERRQSLKEAKNGQKNRKSSCASLPGHSALFMGFTFSSFQSYLHQDSRKEKGFCVLKQMSIAKLL